MVEKQTHKLLAQHIWEGPNTELHNILKEKEIIIILS